MPLRVRGYAAVFGVVDGEDEVIVKGAFSNWIAANPGAAVKLYWMHSHVFDPLAKPIGKAFVKQDRKGLYFEGDVLDTAEGLEVQELIKGGAVRAASFGFKTVDAFRRNGRKHLAELTVEEITAASWGVNSKAYIEADPDQGDQTDGNG